MKILILMAFFTSLTLFAGTTIPFDQNLMEKISSDFLQNGSISTAKLESFKQRTLIKKAEISSVIRNYYAKLEMKNPAKVEKELLKDDSIVTYNIILKFLAQIERDLHNPTNFEKLEEILELEFTVQSMGRQRLFDRALSRISSYIGPRHSISKSMKNHTYPSNLYNSFNNTFYSQDELRNLDTMNTDLSKIEPNPKSRFWKPTNIENINIKEHFYKNSALVRNIDLDFPHKSALYKKVRKTQTKPKFDITFRSTDALTNKDRKQKYKLKVGAEIHSEITAGALSTALGFYADVSQYKKEFKLKLPKGTTVQDVKREWYSYYDKFDIDKYILRTGTDHSGQEYILFKDVLIEAKPIDFTRLGGWAYGGLGHKGKREVRGLFLFNVWISNTDLKEAANNKVLIRNIKTENPELIQYVHDLGFSFGHRSQESPQDFRWKIVSKNTDNKVLLDYRQFQINTGFDHVTFDDAKWMIRKIARLRRNQIKDAVELGGWPKGAGDILVEKLISRRNDLVLNFGLSNEFSQMVVNNNISSSDPSLSNGFYDFSREEDQTIYLGSEVQDILGQVKAGLKELSLNTLASLGNQLEFRVSSDEIGIDSQLFGEIHYKPSRTIQKNPNQTGNDDYYLVHDKLRVKYALGVGAVLRGSIGYVQEYQLSYAVKTYEEARFQRNSIVDFLLRGRIKSSDFPDQTVISVADGFEGQGELRLQTGPVGIRARLGITSGLISKSIIGKKGNKLYVRKTKGHYFRHFQRLEIGLLFAGLPLFNHSVDNGFNQTYAYKLDLDYIDPNQRDVLNSAITDIIQRGHSEGLSSFDAHRIIDTNFVLRRTDYSLLTWKWNNHKLEENSVVQDINENGDSSEMNLLYYETVSKYKRGMNIGVSAEAKSKSVSLLGEVLANGQMVNPTIELKISIDDSWTKSNELKDYIRIANKLALSNSFINFNPYEHSNNGLWERLLADFKVIYDKNSIDTILSYSAQDFYEEMAKNSNRDAKFWSSNQDKKIIDKDSAALRKRFQRFVSKIEKAKSKNSSQAMYQTVVDALNVLVKKKGLSYSTVLLQRVHSLMGKNNFFFEAKISVPENTESTLISDLDLYNNLNPSISDSPNTLQRDSFSTTELWTYVMELI